MKRTFVGLRTYMYTFSLKEREKYRETIARLRKTGRVTEVFINNGYAIEYQQHRKA